MKWLGKCSGKIYSEEESETMPECGIRINDSPDPEWLNELHARLSVECEKCRHCLAYFKKMFEEMSKEREETMKELSRACNGFTEEEYQQKHKKVKDRYSSNKFYANNFKRNKRRKK